MHDQSKCTRTHSSSLSLGWAWRSSVASELEKEFFSDQWSFLEGKSTQNVVYFNGNYDLIYIPLSTVTKAFSLVTSIISDDAWALRTRQQGLPFWPGWAWETESTVEKEFRFGDTGQFACLCLTLWLAGVGFYGHEVIPLASSVNAVGMRGGCNAENRLSPPGRVRCARSKCPFLALSAP